MGTFGLQTFFSDQNEESTRLHDWIWQSLTFLQKWLKGCVPNMSCNNARLLLLQYGYQIMVRKTNSIEWSWRFTNSNMQWQTATPSKAYILSWKWTLQQKKTDWKLKPLPFSVVFGSTLRISFCDFCDQKLHQNLHLQWPQARFLWILAKLAGQFTFHEKLVGD